MFWQWLYAFTCYAFRVCTLPTLTVSLSLSMYIYKTTPPFIISISTPSSTMASLKILALLLISILSISSAALLKPDCGSCSKPAPTAGPNLPLPPVGIPKLPLPPVGIPKLPLPPVGIPKLPLLPPVIGTPKGKGKGKGGCPSPSTGATCPIDTLKLGACVDLLGGLVHVVLGDPAVNECCPLISGLAEVEAAACLCTTLKVKALSLEIFVPLALELLVTCGKTPPPGYTCSL